MHVDLCIQLDNDNDMSPEDLANKVFAFQQSLGPLAGFTVEVMPTSSSVVFLAEMTKKAAEGQVVWDPNPPKDATG